LSFLLAAAATAAFAASSAVPKNSASPAKAPASSAKAAQNELRVLYTSKVGGNWLHFTDAPGSLYRHIANEAYALLEQRSREVAKIASASDWRRRQERVRQTFLDIVGPFPERTPLNPRVLRTIAKRDFRVEHIVFESQPGFLVTSSLFLPGGSPEPGKRAVVIYCSGHAALGYHSESAQRPILDLVRKGFIVFAFDPVGQGERFEYVDEQTGKTLLRGGPTSEHSYPGVQAFITGSSQARHMIWDGIRAVDYLHTRLEVDVSRIGITGRSGGGTQSTHIAALDERILAVAPGSYITNFTRLFQEPGPQDAEQNLYSGILRGLDHADLLAVRAPRPALIIATTGDYFGIHGFRETAREVTRIYRALGAESNFGTAEDDGPHSSTRKNREAMYAFFQRALENPGDPREGDISPLTDDEIRVTPTGQLATSLRGETIHSINRRETEREIARWQTGRSDWPRHARQVVDAARRLSGYREPSTQDEPVFTGRLPRAGYAIEKYFVQGEGRYVVPYLLLRPERSNGRAVLYLHPAGKAAAAGAGEELEWFVRQGFTVLAPDLVGLGETGPEFYNGDTKIEGISYNVWFAAILIGRSVVGIRAGDVVKLTALLQKEDGVSEVYGVARRELAPVLLHAAAFTPALRRIGLIEPYSSYHSFVRSRFYNPALLYSTVPAALKGYDLPDLAGSLVPRPLLISGATDASARGTDAEGRDRDLAVVRSAYQHGEAGQKLLIKHGQANAAPEVLYAEWLR